MKFYKSELFYMSRERKTHSSIPSEHYHDAYEILYICSGDLYYFIGDKTYHAVSGTVLLIRMNDMHKLINPNGSAYERVALLFQEQFLHSYTAEGGFDPLSCFSTSNAVKLKGPEQGLIESLFHTMMMEHANRMPEADVYLQSLLMQLLILLHRKLISSGPGHLIESNRTHRQISQIVNYINHHYTQRLTLEDLSKRFYLSPSHLSRTFKESTGFTFIEYVNNFRVKEACAMLKSSRLSVSDIAERVGFDNLTHFGRMFKSIMGLSPLKYRKSHENQ